jgi:hypothetical protein
MAAASGEFQLRSETRSSADNSDFSERAVAFQNYLPAPFQTALPNTVCELGFRHGCSLTEAGARSVSQPPVRDVGCR